MNRATLQKWFSAADFAAMKLAGLPRTVQKINAKAVREGWRDALTLDGRSMCRYAPNKRGYEYRIDVLTEGQQAELKAKLYRKAQKAVAKKTAAPKGSGPSWDAFERMPPRARADAHFRMGALMDVEGFKDAGKTVDYAVSLVAKEIGKSKATVFSWIRMVKGLERSMWLPALASNHKGSAGRISPCTPKAWEAIKADYLRLEKPTFASCYRRLKLMAAAHGWEIPRERALWDRLNREVKHSTFVLSREGQEEAAKLFPAQQRDRGVYRALEALNADGHMFDFWVKWKDGTVIRPLLLMVQDLYSNKFVGWHVAKTESTTAVRLAFYQVFKNYGIPTDITLDNGMAFASKIMTGGQDVRNRNKIKEGEQDGILTSLGIKVNWATPYHGQAKPIERAFRDLCNDIAKDPRFAGAYAGNSPVNKPAYNHDPRDKAVDYDLFMMVMKEGFGEYNDRKGRRTGVCAGKLSFNQAFQLSIQENPVTKATTEQLRVAMLVAERRVARKPSGDLWFKDNRYWAEFMNDHIGERVIMRFDPDSLHSGMHVYGENGTYFGCAEKQNIAGFNSLEDARLHGNARKDHKKKVRDIADFERSMAITQYIELFPAAAEAEPEPEAKTVKMFMPPRSNTALALDAEPSFDDEKMREALGRGLTLIQNQREI